MKPAGVEGLIAAEKCIGVTHIVNGCSRLQPVAVAIGQAAGEAAAQAALAGKGVHELDVAEAVSWADEERNLTAWLGDPMQEAVHQRLYAMRADVLRAGVVQPELLRHWRDLTTSDHVYYIATKHHSDAEVHDYFSPFDSPHAAFVTAMTAVDDLQRHVDRALGRRPARPPKTKQ